MEGNLMNDVSAMPGGGWTVHPYSSMDRDELRAQLVANGIESQRQLPVLCSDICALLQRCYPPHLLAVLAHYGLQAPVSAEGVAQRSLMSGIGQPHVELLQALILTLRQDQWGQRPAEPDEIQQLIERLKALADAFYHARYTSLSKAKEANERAALVLQERLRGHTQFVRNWGYHGAVLRIARELYGALDDDLTAAYGFGATDVIEVAKALLVDVEQRASERLRRLGAIIRCQTHAEMVHAFFREPDFVEGDPEAFLRQIPETVSREQLAGWIMSHADFQLLKLAIVDSEGIAHATGRNRSVVVRVLERLSREPGSLSADDIPHFFMGNPIWSAPCISTGLEYFFPMPQLVFSHIHSVMRSLLGGLTPAVRNKMARTRAEYLEAQVTDLLRGAFPSARMQAGVKWAVGVDRYETDVLLILDRTVLIVEAKSGALSVQGLRGAPDRVKRHVQELLVEPAVQSDRLAQVIDAAKRGDELSQQIVASLGIDARVIDQVIRLSVTLEDFSILASCEAELKEAGWVPADLELAPTVNLADLGCILEVLEEPAYILHYLANRGSVQRSTGLLGDELDYLGFYLQTAFGMGEVARTDALFAISGLSEPIDRYYTSRDAGVSLPKPTLLLPDTLRYMILEAQRRGRHGWTTVSLALLDIAFHAGDSLDDELLALKQDVAVNPHDPKQPRGLAVLPAPYSDSVVAFYVFPRMLSSTRNEVAVQFAQDILAQTGKARCVVVGRMIETWQQPYSFTAIVFPG